MNARQYRERDVLCFRVKHRFCNLIWCGFIMQIETDTECTVCRIAMPLMGDVVGVKITLLNEPEIVANTSPDTFYYAGICIQLGQLR